MVIGFIIGMIRMGLDFSYASPPCGKPDHRPAILQRVHYFYFALLLFVITIILCISLSLMTESPDAELVSKKIHDQNSGKFL